MTERPPGDDAPDEGTPEFDWLYGSGPSGAGKHRSSDDATRPVPRQPRPEETQVLPVTPEPAAPPAPPAPPAPVAQRDNSTNPAFGGALRSSLAAAAGTGDRRDADIYDDAADADGAHDEADEPVDEVDGDPSDDLDDVPDGADGAAGAGAAPTEVMAPVEVASPRATGPGWGRKGRSRLPSNAVRNEAVRGTTRPTPPPVAPAPGPSRPRRRFRFRLRYVWLLLLLWLVFLVVVPLIAWNKVSTRDAMPAGDRPADQPGTTYLLVGSDSRADLSDAERKKLNTGSAAGGRTDTIMLLHTGSGPNLLMSIPRDSLVPIPGHGTTKINAAYAFGGPKLLVRTIEQNTGIRIDDYVEIGFGGFVELVDAVGGVQICPQEDMVDADANLKIKKGCQDVDGTVALAYSRSRHAQQLGDLDRAAHQREVVSAVGSKVVSPWSVLNPWRYWSINMAAAGAVAIGEGTSPISAGRFAAAMTRVNGDSGLTCGVPISDLAVHWDTTRSQQMFQHIIDDDTKGIGKNLCTPSGLIR